MLTKAIRIINGDNGPPSYPLVVVDDYGPHVDVSKVEGELWDQPTTAEVTWGNKSPDGRLFGTIRLKNGEGRRFWDPELMLPYLKAWTMAKADFDLKATETP